MTDSSPITDNGRALVAHAVAQAEAQSAGEIVTIITPESDLYNDVALVWAALISFLVLTLLSFVPDQLLNVWDRMVGIWATSQSIQGLLELVAALTMGTFIGVWLLLQWHRLRLWMVPPGIKHRRVRARAMTCFKVGAERRTTGRTGILIYLSLAERRAEIVADEAIASKVAPELWGDAMASMLDQIRQGRMAEGMALAVSKVGMVLAEHLPRADDDQNELPDRLIEV